MQVNLRHHSPSSHGRTPDAFPAATAAVAAVCNVLHSREGVGGLNGGYMKK